MIENATALEPPAAEGNVGTDVTTGTAATANADEPAARINPATYSWCTWHAPENSDPRWRGRIWNAFFRWAGKDDPLFTEGYCNIYLFDEDIDPATLAEEQAKGNGSVILKVPASEVFFHLPNHTTRPFSFDDCILDPYALANDDLGRRAAYRSPTGHSYYGTFHAAIPDRMRAAMFFDRDSVPPQLVEHGIRAGFPFCRYVYFTGPKIEQDRSAEKGRKKK